MTPARHTHTTAVHLLDLARASANGDSGHRLYAAAAAIVLFHRPTGKALEGDRLRVTELSSGRAALEALAAFEFPEDSHGGGARAQRG